MEHQALHPNLARLVVAHADLVGRLQAGELTHAGALTELKSLVARDDAGVLWGIDHVGNWVRFTITGEAVVGTPPTQGLATPTAFDVSTPTHGTLNPSAFASIEVADNSLWSTRRRTVQRPIELAEANDYTGVALLAVAAALMVLTAALYIF